MDYYMYFENCYERIVNDYLTHGQLIIAVDFDNTLKPFREHEDDCSEIKQLIKDIKPYAHIIIYSASPKSRYKEMQDYLKQENIPYDDINIQHKGLDYEEGQKLYYNMIIDDRACNLFISHMLLTKFLKNINEINNIKKEVM